MSDTLTSSSHVSSFTSDVTSRSHIMMNHRRAFSGAAATGSFCQAPLQVGICHYHYRHHHHHHCCRHRYNGPGGGRAGFEEQVMAAAVNHSITERLQGGGGFVLTWQQQQQQEQEGKYGAGAKLHYQ